MKYKIEAADYIAMFNRQGGACAICGQPPGKKPLSVDHNHKTGKVRGLLCHTCNTGLGMFTEDIGKLAAAVSYLRERNY